LSSQDLFWLLHCVSTLDTHGPSNLTFLCFNLKCTMIFNVEFIVFYSWKQKGSLVMGGSSNAVWHS
jgi:hypothetical protein